MNIFDIIGLYDRLTGHVAGSPINNYKIPQDSGSVDIDTYGDVKIDVWDDSAMTGNGLRPSSLTGSAFVMPLTIGDYKFAIDPIISVSGAVEIVRTIMPGFAGTIKEEISEDDYRITIRGILINEDNDDYPYEQVSEIDALKKSIGGLKVINKMLNLCFGINQIVIESIEIEGMEGVQSMQSFAISALSDRDVELVETEGW